jgi:hypothetical protein
MNKEDRAQGAVRATERAKLRPAPKVHNPAGSVSLPGPGLGSGALSGNKSWA